MCRNQLVGCRLLAIAICIPANDAQGQQRPFTPRDLLRIESFGAITPSPDGSRAAVVIRRGISAAGQFTTDFLDGNDRADIWLVGDTGGSGRRITDGHADGTGYWAPTWSPDGSRIAMLSTKGGDNVRLYAWDGRTSRLRRLTTRGVDMQAGVVVNGLRRPGFGWLDARRMIVALLPEQESPTLFNIEVHAVQSAPPRWREAARGASTTVSVIDSRDSGSLHGHQIAIVDVETGKQTIVLDAAVRALAISPDGRRAAAVVDEGKRRLSGDARPEHDPRRVVLHLLDFSGDRAAGRRIPGLMPAALFEGIGQWWSPSAELLVLGKRESTSGRNDWWLVTDTAVHNVTSSLSNVPSLVSAGDRLVATINGRVHHLTPSGLSPAEIGMPPIRGIVFPRVDAPSPDGRLLLQDSARTNFVVTLGQSAPPVAAKLPDRGARFEGFLRRSELWSTVASTENVLWSTAREGSAAKRIVLNEWLASVSDGARILVAYRTSSGDSSQALVVLPPGYASGARYPTIAWVYAGNVYRDTLNMMTRKNLAHVLNVQLLAARGYVVVLPTIPLPPEGTTADPLTGMSAHVIAAVDRLVALGIADSTRLGVAGHSYGGYTTLGVVSQTNRFRAAAALSAPANLTSMYGTFDIRRRYNRRAGDFQLPVQWSEAGQGRMGGPPWREVDRYVRNSPVFHAERIETPLLLIHGDQDYVPIGQAEEVFTALNRLGRRVRFARYWGEGHIFKSPANIVDMWEQLHAWFDEHLK